MNTVSKRRLDPKEANLPLKKKKIRKSSVLTAKSDNKRADRKSPMPADDQSRHDVTPATINTGNSDEREDTSSLINIKQAVGSPILELKNFCVPQGNKYDGRHKSNNRLSNCLVKLGNTKSTHDNTKLNGVRNNFPVMFSPHNAPSQLSMLQRNKSDRAIKVSDSKKHENVVTNRIPVSVSKIHFEDDSSPEMEVPANRRTIIQRLCGKHESKPSHEASKMDERSSGYLEQTNLEHRLNGSSQNIDAPQLPDQVDSFFMELDKNQDGTIDNKMSFLMKSINDSTFLVNSNLFSRRDSVGGDILEDL
jgi:hypothetical protein